MSMSVAHITINSLLDFPGLSAPWEHADAQGLYGAISSPISCGSLESWTHSSLVAALMRMGPSPHLRPTIDLILVV